MKLSAFGIKEFNPFFEAPLPFYVNETIEVSFIYFVSLNSSAALSKKD